MPHSRPFRRECYPSGHPNHSPRRPAISSPPPSHILWPIVPAAHLPHFPIDTPAINLKAGVLKADIYDSTLNPAREEDLSHLAFLQMMVQDEIERRETKKLQQRIAKALWIFFAILLLLATAADLPAEIFPRVFSPSPPVKRFAPRPEL